MTSRIRMMSIAATVLVFVVVLVPTVAFANAGVHGNYSMTGTDACAGCHRAHTAPSPVMWEGGGQTHSALLLGSYTEVSDFCLTCHGNVATGADTNVIGGRYEARLSGSSHTFGAAGQPLISGPFGIYNGATDASTGLAYAEDFLGNRVTSTHDYFGATWKVWGAGVYSRTATASWDASLPPYVGAGSQQVTLDCASCHDVHGSSNYRLLKDKVYGGVTVGGYDGVGNPTPYVVSLEPGFPVGGFRLHTEYGTYVPNYTTAYYSKAPTSTTSGGLPDTSRGISGWCVGCHTFYMGNAETSATVYNAGDGFGTITRHRHPVNVALNTFQGPRPTVQDATNHLPLGHDAGESVNDPDDWVDCLTCHYAHGSTSVMSGFADVADSRNPSPNTGGGGVAPTYDSALLRGNNRYVCQECHNK
jgi:hypothetical protein